VAALGYGAFHFSPLHDDACWLDAPHAAVCTWVGDGVVGQEVTLVPLVSKHRSSHAQEPSLPEQQIAPWLVSQTETLPF
jgi:hypothetical protein